jgi:hypothetical protein
LCWAITALEIEKLIELSLNTPLAFGILEFPPLARRRERTREMELYILYVSLSVYPDALYPKV